MLVDFVEKEREGCLFLNASGEWDGGDKDNKDDVVKSIKTPQQQQQQFHSKISTICTHQRFKKLLIQVEESIVPWMSCWKEVRIKGDRIMLIHRSLYMGYIGVK